MNSMLLRAFAYFPSKTLDSLNLIYNWLIYRKNIRTNIAAWNIYRPRLTKDLSKSFRSFAAHECSVEKYRDYIEAYVSEDFELIKGDLDSVRNNNSLIMMCAVKNDLFRIKFQYTRMKQYGVKNFIYIDNGSTDGTKEWLAERNDIVLYSTLQRFNSTIKSAWYRRVVDSIGYNRWYLYLDSDEVYIYPGIEKDKFETFLNFFEKRNIFAVTSLLLDMYPRDPIKLDSSQKMPNLDKYSYFDPYYRVRHYRICKVFYGGPRYRMFSNDGREFDSWLNKTNLVFYQSNFFQYAHYLVPHSLNFKARVVAATLHYKFLPNDFDRILEIAETGNYAGNSKEYKAYAAALKDKRELDFFFQNSVFLGDSSALEEINIMDKEIMREVQKGQ
jgi:hypothetical protein